MTIQDTMGLDAARFANASMTLADMNFRINWDIVGPTLVVAVALSFLIYQNRESVCWLWANNPITRWMERRRMQKKTEKQEEEVMSDYLQDAIDDAFLDDEISAEARKKFMKRLAAAGFTDLVNKADLAKLQEEKEKLKKEEPDKTAVHAFVHIL